MSMSAPSRTGRSRLGTVVRRLRFIVLALLGTLLFLGSVTVRILDRPQDFRFIDNRNGETYTRSFAAGVDPGGMTGFACAYICPLQLQLTVRETDRTIVDGTFYGNVTADQTGPEPARIVLLTPRNTDGFTLDRGSAAGFELTTTEAHVPADAYEKTNPGPVTAAILSVKNFISGGSFAVHFTWHTSGDDLRQAGIGRYNLRVISQPRSVVLRNLDVFPMFPDGDGVDQSLRQLSIAVDIGRGSRVALAEPEPGNRPVPGLLEWRTNSDGNTTYHLMTVENATTRFWVGLLNEQALFAAGLLLGAAIGALASAWFTDRRKPAPD
ncbi:hypothetical protein [Actinoplanes sp. GCM10030250]|uniref:hypothetical protein n=1 Tax=Actinoplanes sp. GCM10030250 TaxID=3273376 RepID=UPI00360EC4D9